MWFRWVSANLRVCIWEPDALKITCMVTAHIDVGVGGGGHHDHHPQNFGLVDHRFCGFVVRRHGVFGQFGQRHFWFGDGHGGSDVAAVSISYQDGNTLTGTSGDDVLVAGSGNNILNGGDGNDVLTAGSGNNTLNGGSGNDLLFSGPGNDLLDGGAGIDTASYAHATAAVTVNLGLAGAQNTLGAAPKRSRAMSAAVASTSCASFS